MAEINRVPRGLLGLLDAKTGGRTPQNADQNLRFGLEQLPFYLADLPQRTATDQDTPVTTSGAHNTIEIPAGELWFVYSMTVDCAALAGIFPVFGGLIRSTDGQQIRIGDQNSDFALGALPLGQTAYWNYTWQTPLVVGAGTVFRDWFTIAPGGAGATVQTSVWYKSVVI